MVCGEFQAKGTDINDLLLTLTPILENLDESQRRDVDQKVESLHKHWTLLKNIAKARTDLVSLYMQFLDESGSLDRVFNEVELILRTAASPENLTQIEKAWGIIRPAHGEIKKSGGRVIDDLAKVSANASVRHPMSMWGTLYLIYLTHTRLPACLYWRISNLWKIYL